MRLEMLGATVVELPSIAFEGMPIELPDLAQFAWLVFTSANGVAAFFDRGLAAVGLDARALGGVRVAAIGPGTADTLATRGVHADLVPERFVAESLLDAFPEAASPGPHVLVARAAAARDVLPDGLRELGYDVTVLPAYRTVTATPDPATLERVRAGAVDVVTFTSSSTVTNLTELLGTVPDPQPLAVSIGPITSATARELGWRVDAEAAEHTIDGVVTTLLEKVVQDRR